jgi:hypothetical protein
LKGGNARAGALSKGRTQIVRKAAAKLHKTLRMPRVMAHGISDQTWTLGELIERVSKRDTTGNFISHFLA